MDIDTSSGMKKLVKEAGFESSEDCYQSLVKDLPDDTRVDVNISRTGYYINYTSNYFYFSRFLNTLDGKVEHSGASVDKEQQGNGIGRTVLRNMMDIYKQLNLQKITLGAGDDSVNDLMHDIENMPKGTGMDWSIEQAKKMGLSEEQIKEMFDLETKK